MKLATRVGYITLLSVSATSVSWADDHAQTIEVGGFIRFDYGAGDRYPEDEGEDRAGISKAALAVTGQKDDITGVLVIGTEALSSEDSDDDGNVDIKDAFIVINDIEGTSLSLSLGAQPLLFGLKPNGYPGDRSLQESIEFGSAVGSVNVAGQGNIAVIARADVHPLVRVEAGLFDQDSEDNVVDNFTGEGSTLVENGFIQLRIDDSDNSGLYGVIGVESLYNENTDDNDTIIDVGIGYGCERFDISAEWITIDEDLASSAAAGSGAQITDDETYIVVEGTWHLGSKLLAYTDWASADELDVDTVRVGLNYAYRSFLTFSAEYSIDDSDNELLDVDSFDIRVSYEF